VETLSKLSVRPGLGLLGIFLLEFLNAASGVKKHLLAGEEWVRGRAHFHFDHRVLLAIGPLGGFLGLQGGAGKELKIARSIPKNHFFIVWMNALFHIQIAFSLKDCKDK
jgi:hypothetical protein